MQPFENFQKLFFFKHSNLRKVNCVAYFVVLRREPIKWAQCMKITNQPYYYSVVFDSPD
jgi:hypothetical protein